MTKKCRFYFIVLVLVMGKNMSAQDVVFSQIFASPLNLNPALTGAYEGNYRIGLQYRNQWLNVIDQGFETFTGSVDLRLKAPNSQYDHIGVGLSFFSDKSGNAPVVQNKLLISAAYHKALGYKKTSFLSAGFYIGPSQRNLDYGDLVFQDQFSGGNFNNPTREILPENSVSFTDLGLGIDYRYVTKKVEAGLGLAIHHIVEPNYSQSLNGTGNPVRAETVPYTSAYKFYGWTKLVVTHEQLYVIPRFNTHIQGKLNLYQIGSTVSMVNPHADSEIQLGLMTKLGNSFSSSVQLYELTALFGMRFSNVVIGLSYDVNVRAQQFFSEHQGGFEISVTLVGNSAGKESKLNPVF